jgi:uncharacterized protein YecT (DUF1311 family)
MVAIPPAIALVIAVSTAVSSATEPQYFPAGFNCKKAKSKIEIIICSDENLAAADVELNTQFKKIMSILRTADGKQLKKDQRDWLKARDRWCTSSGDMSGCIRDAYEQRARLFEKWAFAARGNHFRERYLLPQDPSMIPLDKIPGEGWTTGERYRLVADFNNDGIMDVALSFDTGKFGDGFGQFFLYLGTRDHRYREIGLFSTYPMGLDLKRVKGGGCYLNTTSKSDTPKIGLAETFKVTDSGLFYMGSLKLRFGPQWEVDPASTSLELKENVEASEDIPFEESETKHGIVSWKKIAR